MKECETTETVVKYALFFIYISLKYHFKIALTNLVTQKKFVFFKFVCVLANFRPEYLYFERKFALWKKNISKGNNNVVCCLACGLKT